MIVESPAKAKTIGKYLGPDYQVKASMGHLRDLPKSTLGVDVEGTLPQLPAHQGQRGHHQGAENGGQGQQDRLSRHRPRPRGEAISWHLKHLLELPDEKARRVTFNEITKRW